MRNTVQQTAFLALLLGTSAAAQKARADEVPRPADQIPSDAGAGDSTKPVSSDAVGQNSQRDESLPVVLAPAPRPASKRLPIFGVMADVGLPDGLIGSLTVRPWSWVRLSAGGGTNFISGGWRAGITLLPFGAGPSASFEYGRYQDGDANPMAKRFGFGGSPALERVGYQYMNAHLGLDLGFRRCVFFIHGGVTVLSGQIHNLNAAISAQNASSGTTEVVVRQDPSAKAMGPSLKLGLIVYIR